MTPLVAIALAGWLLILCGAILYATHAVRQNRRAGRDWRPDVRRDRDGGGL